MKPVVRLLLSLGLVLPAVLGAVGTAAQGEALSREWYVGRILFKSDRGGSEAIYAVNPDGSDLQRVNDPNVGFYYAEAKQRDVTTADGRYRLFVKKVGNDFQIWQEDTQSGATAYVVGGTPGADYDPVWAPDSRYVAYVSQADESDEIYVYDRQTHQNRRLTHNRWEWDKHPSWSPDGSQIVFWSNREANWKHIWLMNADGSNQHNISGWERTNDWDPVWVKRLPSEPAPVTTAAAAVRAKGPGCQPEADDYVGKIVFKSDREGSAAFFLLDPATGETCRVDDPNVGFYYAEAKQRDQVTADGRYRLFVRQVSGDYQIWQEDAETGAIAYVIGATRGADYDPVWAPDSRYVAYVSQVYANDEIHLYDRQTKTDKRLTSNTWEWDKHPSWNPDGTQIVFWSNREAQWKHLWTMDADGRNQRNVSGWDSSNDWDPVWFKAAPSPAPVLALPAAPAVLATPVPMQPLPREWYVGRILFKSDRGGSEAIYAVNPDGSDLQRVNDPNVGFYYAEAKQRDVTTADGRYRLFVKKVGNDFQIWQEDTQSGATAYVVGGTAGADYDPAWAPDSRYVAYVSQADESDEIHVFDRQTGQDRRLTRNQWEWDKHPSWSPDGSQIVFWSNREANWKHIWLMNADGSRQQNISGWELANDWDPVWVKHLPSER